MEEPASPDAPRIAALQRELDEARSTLAALRTDLSDAEARLHDAGPPLVQQANEQLVLAMLKAQEEADRSAQALAALNHWAGHDTRTRLPNRALLHDRWMQAAASARRHGKKIALLFIDLDDFKRINDTLGHASGDEVLVAVATRLTGCLREVDTVGRYGGDEFVVLLADVSGAGDAGVIAQKLLAALAAPLPVRGQVLTVSASIGISVYPDDAENVTSLLDLADQAMYSAKRQGGGALQATAALPAADAATSPRPGARPRSALDDLERMNEVLREANERLIEAAMDAAELQEKAERALARHRAYLALLGHEIRTPLSPLRYAAALMDRGPLAEAALVRLRLTIERQVLQIARLVDDMMALSSAGRVRLDVEFHQVDVVALVRQAAEACRPSIDARRQQLALAADPPAQQARVDPVRMVQVFSNLIDNASKYTPLEGQIGVTVTGTPGEVVIAVEDSGMGISVADARTLFDPFVRAPEALASGSSGLGIGLTVVRELVAAHRGSVQVHSAGVGQGTTFVVRLPR